MEEQKNQDVKDQTTTITTQTITQSKIDIKQKQDLSKYLIANINQPIKKEITCPQKGKAMMMCSSLQCQAPSFICFDAKCKCKEMHSKKCFYRYLDDFYLNLIKQKMSVVQKDIRSFIAIDKILDYMINTLSDIRYELIQARQDFGLQNQQADLMKIIQKQMYNDISGKIINKAYNEWQNGQKPTIIAQEDIIATWEPYNENFKRICIELRNFFSRDSTAKIKATQKSLITQEFMQLQKWIQPQFGKPIKQFRLLYRASQNDFSVAQFHQKCDGKANTLVLVKNQFDKVIGGFTNKQWNQSGSYQTNQDRKSFIFSLSLNQKYTTVNTSYSIYGGATYGPTFGGGHDIYICDGSNKTGSSYFNFPHSYNLTQRNYTNNQYSYAMLCGKKSGYQTIIKQYEVYQVS